MNKIKYHFIYGRKTRNQISRMFRYRRRVVVLKERLNSPGQYGIGWMIVADRGVEKIGPGKININPELFPTLK